jgi:hypothetical protein
LHKGPLDLPSDIAGIAYVEISKGIRAADADIRREVKALFPTRKKKDNR